MEFFSSLFYFIIVISVLVFIHEWGHFIAAKLTGMRAEVFSVGMGKRLFGWNNKTGFTRGNLPKNWESTGETDYRISLLPIGGYVKISGMIDENYDNDFTASEPKSNEFRSKNTLQKAFVLSAGVIMNFLLAVGIFAGITYSEGETLKATTTVAAVSEKSIASQVGIQPGDEIISINNKEVNNWNDLSSSIAIKDFGEDKSIKLNRNGEIKTLTLKNEAILNTISNKESVGIYPKGQRVVFTFVETLKPAGEAGFKEGDTVLTINGEDVYSTEQLINKVSSNKNKEISLTVKRESGTETINVTPDEDGKIGVGIFETYSGEYIHREFDIFTSIGKGFSKTIEFTELTIKGVGQIISGNIAVDKAIGGPIMIAQQSASSAQMGLQSFLTFMAILSISLALLNILPIPALDGGHLIIVLVEAIYRKELPIKLKLAIQNIGMIFLLTLMAVIIIFDILR